MFINLHKFTYFFLIYRARDSFEGTFTQAPLDALRYLSESDFVEKTMKLQGTQPVEAFEKVKKVLVDDLPKNFEDCLTWARHLFQDLFHNQIAQLLHNFPADQTTSSGELNKVQVNLCQKLLFLHQ